MKRLIEDIQKYWLVLTGGLVSIVFVVQLYDKIMMMQDDVAFIKPRMNWLVKMVEATSGEKYSDREETAEVQRKFITVSYQ